MTSLSTQKKLVSGTLITSLVLICILMLRTKPTNVGPIGIICWFVLVYIVAVSFLGLVWLLVKRRSLHYPAIFSILAISLVLILLIGLKSLNQLHVRDILVIACLLLVTFFYIQRRFRT